ncbi:MAG: hypothetical protein JSS20_11780 [Proteobacteria bacterium]|nr:hypothetical protein [Pseudomonadota bacterium]
MRELATLADRRRVTRLASGRPARLSLARGIYLDCTVREISPMGASVELAIEAFVPLQFRLLIADDLFEADCSLRHRRGTLVGVEFVSSRAEALARYG